MINLDYHYDCPHDPARPTLENTLLFPDDQNLAVQHNMKSRFLPIRGIIDKPV